MTFLGGAIIGTALLAILTGNEPSCPQFTFMDEEGIEITHEVCMFGSVSGSVDHWRGEVMPEAAIPEPSVWGVMLVGFGLAGWGLRRSRAALHVPFNRVSDDLGTAGPVRLCGGIDLGDQRLGQAKGNQRIAPGGRSAALFRYNIIACLRHGLKV
jgi:hypothetical protein